MEFGDRFLPLAGDVGLLSVVTYFFIVWAAYCLLGSFLFSALTRTSVAPEHSTSRVLTALIGFVAGISYLVISEYYRGMLRQLAGTPPGAAREELIRDTYFAIGQLRYIDWAFTTPLLLIKTVLMLKVKPHQAAGAYAALVLADLFMIFTGYIGQQQYDRAAGVLAGSHYFWGTISTVGYVVIIFLLYRIYQRFAGQAKPEERRAYRLMALTTVTFWGVYPVGYILYAAFPGMNLNWIHIAFSIADVINKVGAGAIVYIAGKKILEDRVGTESKEFAMNVG